MYIFFDLGSTLVDETLCEHQRVLDTVAGTSVSPGTFEEAMRQAAEQNKPAYASACAFFALPKQPWRQDLERLYPGVGPLLKRLSERHSLGLIANQAPGLDAKLKALGIGGCFSVVVGSGDRGAAKPNPLLFWEALARAACLPEQAVMVGDRLDNDIAPAQSLGMKTVWVRQGFGAYGNPAMLPKPPDVVINSILELETIF